MCALPWTIPLSQKLSLPKAVLLGWDSMPPLNADIWSGLSLHGSGACKTIKLLRQGGKFSTSEQKMCLSHDNSEAKIENTKHLSVVKFKLLSSENTPKVKT